MSGRYRVGRSASVAPFAWSIARSRSMRRASVDHAAVDAAAAASASPTSMALMSRSCQVTDRRPESDEKRSRSARRRTGDRDAVQVVVGADRRVGVTGCQRRFEAAVSPTHSFDISGPDEGDRRADRQLVQRGHDLLGVADRLRLDVGNERRLARRRNHQADASQPQQGFPHRSPAHSEPMGNLVVAQLFARPERPVHNRIAQPRVDLVAQQSAGGRQPALGNGHGSIDTRNPASRRRLRTFRASEDLCCPFVSEVTDRGL